MLMYGMQQSLAMSYLKQLIIKNCKVSEMQCGT